MKKTPSVASMCVLMYVHTHLHTLTLTHRGMHAHIQICIYGKHTRIWIDRKITETFAHRTQGKGTIL